MKKFLFFFAILLLNFDFIFSKKLRHNHLNNNKIEETENITIFE